MTVTELPRHSTAEPTARTARWMPSRAGILNVWRYYDEVFEFHEGRLLLRGPNGSGKSKALELLLPFLYDASLRANRLSTFGTSERTMHWNLMGEGASGTTRVGYVWMEFRFPGEPQRWFTCGARLQASTHTTTVHPDYFTTSLRVGSDGFSLVNQANQPLTKNALEERLGSNGVVYGNAGDYRAEVRTTLFPGLSEQRFDALITALLQLRQPKLSQRLDPSLLSNLLSKALPPLGEQEISDLAEGFERLDAQRERLNSLEEEVAATRTLASRQQTYARRVLRAGAANVISATTELENLARDARTSAELYEKTAQRKEKPRTTSRNSPRRSRSPKRAGPGCSKARSTSRGKNSTGCARRPLKLAPPPRDFAMTLPASDRRRHATRRSGKPPSGRKTSRPRPSESKNSRPAAPRLALAWQASIPKWWHTPAPAAHCSARRSAAGRASSTRSGTRWTSTNEPSTDAPPPRPISTKPGTSFPRRSSDSRPRPRNTSQLWRH